MSDNAKNSLYKLSYKAKKDVKRPFFAYYTAINLPFHMRHQTIKHHKKPHSDILLHKK